MSRRHRHQRFMRQQNPTARASGSGTGASCSRIAFHQGKALRHLANTYPTLQATILELVQNALDRDVRATRVSIMVNLKSGRLVVSDNGKGISVDTMNHILTTIADSTRSAEQKRGGLGQFALGLVSPLGKCEYYTFTSCPEPHLYGYNEWAFRCQQIEDTKDSITVPMRTCQELTLAEAPERGKTRVTWRTKVELHGLAKDSYVSRLEMDDLVAALQSRFSSVMHKNKVVISIKIVREDDSEEVRPNVQARQFRGQKLPEYKVESPEAGVVSIQLYVAPRVKGKRSGDVVLGTFGSEFRFPFQYFARSAVTLLKPEVVTALSSGVFEGEIVASKVRQHPGREAFLKDDAYIGLCVALEAWFEAEGSKHLKAIQQSRQDARYQELGLRSLKVLENLLRNPRFANLLAVLQAFKFGLAGAGHKEPKKGEVVEIQDQRSLSTDGQPGQPREPDPQAEPRERGKPSTEKEKKIHPTATGPRGQKRRVVKHASFGLQLTYDDPDLLGSTRLWELDATRGILAFNIRHPHWEACEKRDTTLMQLQEYVAIQALTLHSMPDAFRDRQREVLDEVVPSFVHWICNATKTRGKPASVEA